MADMEEAEAKKAKKEREEKAEKEIREALKAKRMEMGNDFKIVQIERNKETAEYLKVEDLVIRKMNKL